MANAMKINWFSNSPLYPTGYGVQTKLFVPRLKRAGYDMSITSFAGIEGSIINWDENIPIFPRGYHSYGQDVLEPSALTLKADVVISLMDAWVCEPGNFPNTRWIPWFPIDSEPITRINLDKVRLAYKRLVFSKHGCRMMDQAGLDYDYIPHGVDTDVYKPMDRAEARKHVYEFSSKLINLPGDRFIVGMVAANKGFPSRKAFAENIAAFKLLHDKYPDALLYLHTSDGTHMEGMNIPEYLKFIGLTLGKDVLMANQYQYVIGHPATFVNALYNCFDVHLLVSKGEGFGVPVLEAQSAGCPVIVGDWTAMPEICFSGWKVSKADSYPEYTQYGSHWFVPRIDAIYDKLNEAYHKKGNQIYRDRARTGALAYDADKIVEEYWKPYLEKLSAVIADENKHRWAKLGVFNHDGSLSVPCIDCDAERKGVKIIEDGFKPVFDSGVTLDLVPDDDGVSKIVCREIAQDYDLDGLNLKPGDVVLDIGAHKGIVSCYLAKRYPGVDVHSFEPVRANYEALKKNKELNGIDLEITPYHMGVTKDGRDIHIAASEGNSGGGSMADEGELATSTTLENIINRSDNGRIALLKIDCEGAEYEILEGAGDLLKRVDHIRGEFHGGIDKAEPLIKYVRQFVPDVKVTVQG